MQSAVPSREPTKTPSSGGAPPRRALSAGVLVALSVTSTLTVLVCVGLAPRAVLSSTLHTLVACLALVVSTAALARVLTYVPLAAAVVVLMALRAPLAILPPVLSDDVYRYVHEGRADRVSLELPYRVAPRDLALPFDDDVSARVNHGDVRAAYPPLSQLVLLVVSAIGDALARPLSTMKAFFLALDALLVVLLFAVRRRLVDERAAIVYGAHPLPLVAIGLGPHLDVLGALLVVAAIAVAVRDVARSPIAPRASSRRRLFIAGALVGLATHVKPLALLALVGLPRRVPLLAGLVVAVLAPALPYLAREAPLFDGLFAYGSRWRASPVLFPLFEGLFSSWSEAREAAGVFLHVHVDVTRRALLVEEAGVPLVALGTIGPGAPRLLVDGGLLARAFSAVCFGVAVLGIAQARALSDVEKIGAALVAYLFLTPTLHPWYFLWLLPLGAALGSSSHTWLSTAALALYLPRIFVWRGEGWRESALTSIALVAAFTLGAVRDRRRHALAERAPRGS